MKAVREKVREREEPAENSGQTECKVIPQIILLNKFKWQILTSYYTAITLVYFMLLLYSLLKYKFPKVVVFKWKIVCKAYSRMLNLTSLFHFFVLP